MIIGSGKTGIDAALYLLDRGVDPDTLTWVMPNDAWFLNRNALYPAELADDFVAQLRAIHDATTMTGAFEKLEAQGRVLRLDKEIWPTKYRCATVTAAELASLRRIKDIERRGRVSRIEGSTLELATGIRQLPEDASDVLYIDCTADGLAQRPATPIFAGDRITLQSISMCQQVMSAAALAAIELRESSDEAKNEIFIPVPHPLIPEDFLRCFTITMHNQERAGRKLFVWLFRKRLSAGSHMGVRGVFRFFWHVLRTALPTDEETEAMIEAG